MHGIPIVINGIQKLMSKLIKQYLDINVCNYSMIATDFDLQEIVEFPDPK